RLGLAHLDRTVRPRERGAALRRPGSESAEVLIANDPLVVANVRIWQPWNVRTGPNTGHIGLEGDTRPFDRIGYRRVDGELHERRRGRVVIAGRFGGHQYLTVIIGVHGQADAKLVQI